MPGGKAYGADRESQVLCRDILAKRAGPLHSVPYAEDGIDVPFRLGSADRTFDVALTDGQGRLVVAECRRTKDPVKLTDFDAFARRVELLRQASGRDVAGVYFTKTAYREGAVKAAQDSAIEIATCAQDQPLSSFSLVFRRFAADRDRRLRQGEAWFEGSVRPGGSLAVKIICGDGSVEDRGLVG